MPEWLEQILKDWFTWTTNVHKVPDGGEPVLIASIISDIDGDIDIDIIEPLEGNEYYIELAERLAEKQIETRSEIFRQWMQVISKR